MEEDLIEEIEEKEHWYKGPLKWIVGVFLLLMIVSFIIPSYGIKLDPSPIYIPSIDEVFSGENATVHEVSLDYLDLLEPTNPKIKQAANKIVSLSGCKSSKVCNAKAIFYFVQQNINYVNDPVSREYLASTTETLSTGSGDCDDYSILLSNLLQSIGIPTRFVFVPGHVYVQANLPDAMKKYKQENSWVNLDATCSNCEFGNIPSTSVSANKRYLG
jgi:hypothetical protein